MTLIKNRIIICVFFILTNISLYAQQLDSIPVLPLVERIQPAPESVFKKFREAGMDPVSHSLTEGEREAFQKSLSLLPNSYKKVLQEHLHSFSFMDNMPNTALTSTLDTTVHREMFNITFRAGIFQETISEWATWKENMCYKATENGEYQLRIDAGDLNAMVYVLFHEATHIMDVVMGVTPKADDEDSSSDFTPFTQDVWSGRNRPVETYVDSLLETTRFRGGKPISIARASEIYSSLKKTPFVSLYGMASWNEDLAELATIYHLTMVLKQPYSISVTHKGVEIFRFEPMENDLVKNRLQQLQVFYKNGEE
ncbi:hypothetical protein V1387_10645 [Allomuricauda taeanensis]|uniref:hypothetical protein n=1 Tax=Flagellimonas taeanensis TaxID=1005926 RepID=UPI002E7B5F07|nr:hypothetical protein [Allomuricauda taeanensis]MEE1963143.1 hypothetical protein [Allomuricauda taeanensis]